MPHRHSQDISRGQGRRAGVQVPAPASAAPRQGSQFLRAPQDARILQRMQGFPMLHTSLSSRKLHIGGREGSATKGVSQVTCCTENWGARGEAPLSTLPMQADS